MLRIKRVGAPLTASFALSAAAALLVASAGCRQAGVTTKAQPVTLRIGFGLAAGASPERGVQQVARVLAFDQLVSLPRDGRVLPRVAESWSVSNDGLTWRVRLRADVVFHDGKPADARVVQRILEAQLPQALGPAFRDVKEIRAVSERDIEFSLRQRSTFLLERFDLQIQQTEAESGLVGTGPFFVTKQNSDQIEMRANDRYFAATPSIDRVIIKPYTSVRAAWADMLRGQVDVLYDVGVDALDSLEASRDVKVFTFQRGFAYVLLLNVRKAQMRDPAFRRQLNAAIDREDVVRDVLRGHGTPADGVVWPQHWAYSTDFPKFKYEPHTIEGPVRPRLKCIFNEPTYERLALVVQRQLQAIGVDLQLELITDNKVFGQRLEAGDFDAFLTDIPQGPPLVRPFLFWYTGAPFNYGHFSSAQVDAAFDAIRHAANDGSYKAGVADLQRAIVEDPPAVFLAWRERARAVSTRFLVPAESGTDILTTLHLWRPATEEKLASRN